MHPTLEINDANRGDVKRKFLACGDHKELESFFELEHNSLIYYLYRIKDNYSSFEISKKRGGVRVICAPKTNLKIIQRKLLQVLNLFDESRDCVHGFRIDKGIRSNAATHVESKQLLNLDLKDFFSSINFGRVRGLFMSKPFEFNSKVATVLAQVCCHDGVLPQGAPTSPILSNMICRKLDGTMANYLNKRGCKYSRYADDITISTRKRRFDFDITLGKSDLVGSIVRKIINDNGFQINEDKTRVNGLGSHQEVTGVVVNEKLNVARRYVKMIRSILYISAKNGTFVPNAKRLRGMIEHVGAIKGKRSNQYIEFLNKYNSIAGNQSKLLFPENNLRSSLWIVDGGATGTGFFVGEIGLITCLHVIEKRITECFGAGIMAYRADDPSTKYSMRVKKYGNKYLDYAVLSFEDSQDCSGFSSIEIEKNGAIRLDSPATCAGFPLYQKGDSADVRNGIVTAVVKAEHDVRLGDNTYSDKIRYRFSPQVASGMSGGPLINDKDKVVGIIITGEGGDTYKIGMSIMNSIMPIGDMLEHYYRP